MKRNEELMKRYLILYFVTLLSMAPLDFLFLGVLAKGFFQSQVGGILGSTNFTAAILFYLIYAAGVVVFVTATAPDWKSAALFGALLGFVAYATFDLTTMALIKGWTWPAVALDLAWGTFVTALVSALSVLVANAVK